jgi:phosphoglycolate phosphatase-like HAD superfamily hydrolase
MWPNSRRPNPVLIFDLDGVITSEQLYWNSAAAVVDQIRLGSASERSSLPISLIAYVKSRAINSNWDLAYLSLCSHFLTGVRSWNDSEEYQRRYMELGRLPESGFADVIRTLHHGRETSAEDLVASLTIDTDEVGVDFLRKIGDLVDRQAPFTDQRFTYGGKEWKAVHDLCQQFHTARIKAPEDVVRELSIVEVSPLEDMLKSIALTWGAELGVATGRPRPEAERALGQFGLLHLFSPRRIVCYDDVTVAEAAMKTNGATVSLSKPHPYSILRAALPDAPQSWIQTNAPDLSWAAYVGDGVSDVIAAKAAGATSIGVLTGVPDVGDLRSRRSRDLLAAGCDTVVPTVLDVSEALSRLGKWEMIT